MASTWFDPTRDQTHDLLHSWQALGLTQPGIKPMIYYTHGKHLVWPNQGSNPWSIALVASTWFDPTWDQTHDLLHLWQTLGLTQPGIKPMIYYTCGKHLVWPNLGSNPWSITLMASTWFDPTWDQTHDLLHLWQALGLTQPGIKSMIYYTCGKHLVWPNQGSNPWSITLVASTWFDPTWDQTHDLLHLWQTLGLTQPGIKPMIYYTCGKHLVWPNLGSNPWSITLVASTWFDPTRDQTHDLLHLWQALGLTQPGIKPMIYYTRGKHLVWPNQGSNPWSITLVASTWFDPTWDQTHDLLHSWQALGLTQPGIKPMIYYTCGKHLVWPNLGSNPWSITLVASTWFDPTWDQTHDLLHSWQALGLTQPGIKPMIYYTRGKHLVWPNQGSNPWSITLVASTWFDPTRVQTHDLLHSWQALGLTQPGIKPMIYYTRGKHLVWPNQGSNPWSITLVASTWFDPTRVQTHDLLHSWQALGLTQPGIKPMIYYTHGKHLVWPNQGSNPWSITLMASTWFDPTRDQTHDLLHSWQALGLTQPGIKPMIYYTCGKHANDYTTDAGYWMSCISWSWYNSKS